MADTVAVQNSITPLSSPVNDIANTYLCLCGFYTRQFEFGVVVQFRSFGIGLTYMMSFKMFTSFCCALFYHGYILQLWLDSDDLFTHTL